MTGILCNLISCATVKPTLSHGRQLLSIDSQKKGKKNENVELSGMYVFVLYDHISLMRAPSQLFIQEVLHKPHVLSF